MIRGVFTGLLENLVQGCAGFCRFYRVLTQFHAPSQGFLVLSQAFIAFHGFFTRSCAFNPNPNPKHQHSTAPIRSHRLFNSKSYAVNCKPPQTRMVGPARSPKCCTLRPMEGGTVFERVHCSCYDLPKTIQHRKKPLKPYTIHLKTPVKQPSTPMQRWVPKTLNPTKS